MPLPFVLWGAAAAAAALGVKKGFDAKENFDHAEDISNAAKKRFEAAKNSHERLANQLQTKSQDLGALKLDVFRTEIAYTIEVLKKIKKSKSTLKGFQTIFTENEINIISHSVEMSLEISDAGEAVTGAVLAGLGVYGAVGMLASASTGTAIATLSGAAAANATLAWLGGGALAAGGFGMAGGMIALGGIVAAPALLIGGYIMASKAEEAVSDAKEYSAKVDVSIAKMKGSEINMRHIISRIDEVNEAILTLRAVFSKVMVSVDSQDRDSIEKMLLVAKSLKELLDIDIVSKEGDLNSNSGFLLMSAKAKGLEVLSS